MRINFIFLLFLIFFVCNVKGFAQTIPADTFHLSISPLVDQEKEENKTIISTLKLFLTSKNNSLTENPFWVESDFATFKYPYSDLYQIERSRFGDNYFQPTLMEITDTENENQKVVKLAYIGHNTESKDNSLKTVYNLCAIIQNNEVKFSNFLNYATRNWKKQQAGSITYLVSPQKTINKKEIKKQEKEIFGLCKFFVALPLPITYYSCINPVELFQIKGFDYNAMMYSGNSGGLAEAGGIIFSGNSSEYYTHEIVHVYTNHLFPDINKLLDEGFATLTGGSGQFNYQWHRQKIKDYLLEFPDLDLAGYTDAYQRSYINNETPLPYMAGALICERVLRMHGKERLFELFRSKADFWELLKEVGLTKQNLNLELRKELQLPFKSLL